MAEEKNAVAAGYWHLFRFDPRLAEEGKNPFTLDSKAPSANYKDFILGENRYRRLLAEFPERAEVLFEQAEKQAAAKYTKLEKMAQD
jgi:pyruvate-ferredoxin/flavodoxin oxidoreductase